MDDEFIKFEHWYALMNYLEHDDDGHLKQPWKIVDGAPEWCKETLKAWKEQKEKGFKVP